MENKVLSAGQAAKVIGIDQSTLWRWMKSGRIIGTPSPVPGRAEQYYGYAMDEVLRVKAANAKRLRRFRARRKERLQQGI